MHASPPYLQMPGLHKQHSSKTTRRQWSAPGRCFGYWVMPRCRSIACFVRRFFCSKRRADKRSDFHSSPMPPVDGPLFRANAYAAVLSKRSSHGSQISPCMYNTTCLAFQTTDFFTVFFTGAPSPLSFKGILAISILFFSVVCFRSSECNTRVHHIRHVYQESGATSVRPFLHILVFHV